MQISICISSREQSFQLGAGVGRLEGELIDYFIISWNIMIYDHLYSLDFIKKNLVGRLITGIYNTE